MGIANKIACDISDFLYGTCTLKRDTSNAQDSYGEYMPNYTDVATNVPCVVQASSGNEFIRGALVIRYDYNVFMAYDDAAPQEGDHITSYTVDGKVDSNTYVVVWVFDDAGKRHHWQCLCKTVNPS